MRPLTCACLQAGHKGAGRGGPAPLSQKTDLLRTCTSWQTLAWGSAGSPCAYRQSGGLLPAHTRTPTQKWLQGPASPPWPQGGRSVLWPGSPSCVHPGLGGPPPLMPWLLPYFSGDETRGRTRDLTRWPGCPVGLSRKPSVCWQNQFPALKQNQMRATPVIFMWSLPALRIPPLREGLLNLNYSFQKNTQWQPLKYVS